MGDLFRSDEMVLAQLFIQPESAYFTISELGEAGIVQFRDLNENVNCHQRSFVGEVRRCDEMERRLRYIERELNKVGIPIPDMSELPRAPNPREFIDLEAHLEKAEGDIRGLAESAENLTSEYLELIEWKHLLEKTQSFFNEQSEVTGTESMWEENHISGSQLGYFLGVINREKVPGFERMLWRTCRGNVLLRQVEIENSFKDPKTGDEVYKTVFAAFFQGEQLKIRVQKICDGFHASLYNCPIDSKERREMLKDISTQIEDLTLVLNKTQDHRSRVLSNVAKELQNWIVMVRKMKAIFHTMNSLNMDVTKKCLIGECWVPHKNLNIVQEALLKGSTETGSSISSFLNVIHTNDTPPTYYRTNKFTRGFQNLIDSYGIASYREVNPALYTIITFPFLFAVMFGDFGHGVIMTLFALALIIPEKKIQAKRSSSEIGNIFFAGRYIILLMGVFSMYTGFVYNDVFSKSMNIFGSSWFTNVNQEQALENDEWDLDPRYDYEGTPYFIGLDPAWQLARNKIIFLNSFKMKLSIIFGVVHMIFGICVGVFNFLHFRKHSSIILEFIPQILLLCFLFLYMVVMMFIKWIWYSADEGQDVEYGTSCAPSVLIYFINMMLFKQQDPAKGCKMYMYEGQETVQQVLVLLSLICIPVLLLGKPFYIKFTRKNATSKLKETQSDATLSEHYEEEGEEEEEEEPMSEIFIHQAIHTIEYVLSTISHTASYLRLWALSLAHAQLSEVLWNMLFQMGLKVDSFAGAFMAWAFFAVWAFFTIAILVVMEGLSAFLHTLRLHWVEFMSKFYEGLGYPFEPLSFKHMMEQEDIAEE